MAFDVAADAYDRFMGRYSTPLAAELLRVLGPEPGCRALDVGCGPGTLTGQLAALLGATQVAAVEPSGPFVDAVRARLPGVDVRRTPAEVLPFDDGQFDLVVAQLVIPFVRAPDTVAQEMARVAALGGVVAATAWDHGGRGSPLAPFWSAVDDLDPGAHDEAAQPGVRDGDLVSLLRSAGLVDVRQLRLAVTVRHATFEEWWEPYTYGVGPAGDHVARLDPTDRDRLRDRARDRLGDGPINVTGAAWCAVGRT